RRRHTRCYRDWSSDVCSSDLSKLAPSSSGRPGRQVPVALPLANSPPPPSTTAVDIAKRQDENELLRSQVRAAALRKIPPLRFLRSEERRVGNDGSYDRGGPT